MRVCFDTCVFLLICVCLCWCVYACVDTCVYMCWCMCVFVLIHACACLCWCMCACVDRCVLVCMCVLDMVHTFVYALIRYMYGCWCVRVCLHVCLTAALLMVLALCDSNACWMLDDCIWVLRNQKRLDAWVYYSFLVCFPQRTFWAIWRSGSCIFVTLFASLKCPLSTPPFDLLWLFNSIVTATFSQCFSHLFRDFIFDWERTRLF